MSEPISFSLPNGPTAQKLVNYLVSSRPHGASRNSCYPYYRETFALWVKPSIDKMIESKQDLVFPYSVFCTEESGISPQTLYMRVNQGIRFLLDVLDKDKYYFNWYSTVLIERSKEKRAVTISTRPEFRLGANMQPSLVEPLSAMPIWRRALDNWVESGESKPFCKEGLCLTTDQIKQLNNEFAGVAGLLCSITGQSIKIIRTI